MNGNQEMHHYWFHFSQNGTNAIEDFGLGKIRQQLKQYSTDAQIVAAAKTYNSNPPAEPIEIRALSPWLP
jgi:hypothetical protein